MRRLLLCTCVASMTLCLRAQEASSGIDVRATVSVQGSGSTLLEDAPRFGRPVVAGVRAVAYPTLKLDQHWTVTAALQAYTRPYFYDSLTSPTQAPKVNLLQGSLNYARVSEKGSLQLRAGALSTLFGSFLLRYDDADNPLVDMPLQYGYYYSPLSTLPVWGVQADITRGKWDARGQFANSSPSNPRGITARDQYGNWAAGAGYTIRQGLRVGASGFYGPYLDHDHGYIPGERSPNKLPAYAGGADLEWIHGYWALRGEAQMSVQPWTAIPNTREQDAYIEARRTLSPRWYAATRAGFRRDNLGMDIKGFEVAAGFRPNRLQLIKLDYELRHQANAARPEEHTVTVQLVTSFHVLSWARR